LLPGLLRRGTSISVMDFQPSTVPQELPGALQLLAVTSKQQGRDQGTTLSLAAS
jgi:hypothetical protein